MIISTDTQSFNVERIDFKLAASRDIHTDTPWVEGKSDGGQYVNVKVKDNRIIAIETFSGRVYSVDGI